MAATMLDRVPAMCHPDRRRARKTDGCCLDCVLQGRRAARNPAREARGLTLFHPVDLTPRRIAGVEQRAVVQVPRQCRKCGNRLLRVEGRRVSCPGAFGGCGADWYLVAP